VVEIRIPRPLYERLREALLGRRDVESKAFLLARALEVGGSVFLLAREVIPVPDEAYEERSAGAVVVRREFVRELLIRCALDGLSLIEAHTHPWSQRVRFSGIDARSNPRKFRATEVLGPPFRHAALVFGGDESFQGELWDPEAGRAIPVQRIKIIGPGLEIRYGTDQAEPEGAAWREIYDRQIRALGEAGQRLLSGCAVGLVGAGGLGSMIAQALALLGVGRLILVDPDVLEPSNASRVVGIRARDVQRGRRKVTALAEGLRRLAPHPLQVEALPHPVNDPRAWEALLGVDVLIGAVDSAAARAFLNRLAVATLTPYLDGGVGIRAAEGRMEAGGGQVRVVRPGAGFCLMCLDEEAWERSVEEMDAERRAAQADRGYIRGEPVPHPQVIFLNGVVAHLLVWEFVKLMTGVAPVVPYVYYDLMAQRVFAPEGATPRPGCLACSPEGWLAGGREVLSEAGQPARPGTAKRTG
jgi:molybdopterin/thiamine biosynthesis adenylyltransferase